MFIVAEKGKSLRLLNSDPIADESCWFCVYGISLFLFPRGDLPIYLLGKEHSLVKFAEIFAWAVFAQSHSRLHLARFSRHQTA